MLFKAVSESKTVVISFFMLGIELRLRKGLKSRKVRSALTLLKPKKVRSEVTTTVKSSQFQ